MRGHFPIWFLVFLYFSAFLVRAQNSPMLVAALSDEEKKRLFLKAREDIHMSASPTPTPQKSKPRPAAREKATPAPRPKPTPVPTSTPRATPPKQPQRPPARPSQQETARKQPTPTPEPVRQPTPPPRKSAEDVSGEKESAPSAPVVIEKSGLSQDVGYEPPPSTSGGFFGWGAQKFRYLSPSVRKQIDRARVLRGRWKYIVIHNSGTRQGNARAFDLYHRKVRKMQNGMAYHFVIGDGHGSGDGEIEIGNRWTQQINGGHVASDYLNNIAIGICLVGDFNRDRPTRAQLAALEELTGYLRKRVGRFEGKQSTVMAHKEINPRPTDCPGTRFPYDWLHSRFH